MTGTLPKIVNTTQQLYKSASMNTLYQEYNKLHPYTPNKKALGF